MAGVACAPWSALRPWSRAIVEAALLQHPQPAISVWTPQAPTFAPILKCYSDTFLDLCDAVTFPQSDLESVYMMRSPIFLSAQSERTARASAATFSALLDAIRLGARSHGQCQLIHVSRVGRAKRVLAEVCGAYVQGALCEWVVTETPLPEPAPNDTPALRDARAAQNNSAPPPSSGDSTPPPPRSHVWVLLANERGRAAPGGFVWQMEAGRPPPRKVRRSDEFACEFCAATSTVLRRRGPGGPMTLCNRCGIKWRKEEQVQQQPPHHMQHAVLAM